MELPEAHRRALDATARIVAGIRPDQWEAATPCSAWDVRAVLNHLVGENLWVVELGRGATIEEVGDRLDGDVLGADPVAAYKRSAAGAAAVFDAPDAMEQPFAVSYGPVPGVVYAGHRFVDALIHGWDLAVATEQDTRLDPELVDLCLETVAPQMDMLEASGVFGLPLEVPDHADEQTRLLALLGRESV